MLSLELTIQYYECYLSHQSNPEKQRQTKRDEDSTAFSCLTVAAGTAQVMGKTLMHADSLSPHQCCVVQKAAVQDAPRNKVRVTDSRWRKGSSSDELSKNQERSDVRWAGVERQGEERIMEPLCMLGIIPVAEAIIHITDLSSPKSKALKISLLQYTELNNKESIWGCLCMLMVKTSEKVQVVQEFEEKYPNATRPVPLTRGQRPLLSHR